MGLIKITLLKDANVIIYLQCTRSKSSMAMLRCSYEDAADHIYSIESSQLGVLQVLETVLLYLEPDTPTLLSLSATCKCLRFLCNYLPHWDYVCVVTPKCSANLNRAKEFHQVEFSTRDVFCWACNATLLQREMLERKLREEYNRFYFMYNFLSSNELPEIVRKATSFFMLVTAGVFLLEFITGCFVTTTGVGYYGLSYAFLFCFSTTFFVPTFCYGETQLIRDKAELEEKIESLYVQFMATQISLLYAGSVILSCGGAASSNACGSIVLDAAITCLFVALFLTLTGVAVANSECWRATLLYSGYMSYFLMINPLGFFTMPYLLDYILEQCG